MKILPLHRIIKTTAFALTLVAFLTHGRAAVITEYTFNDITSLSTALAPSSVASGLTIGQLTINPSFGYSGFSPDPPAGQVYPPTPNDGYGFGTEGGQRGMYFRRATYFNTSPVPSPRPTVDSVTRWGTSEPGFVGTSLALAPMSFTITTNATTTLTLNSATILAGAGQPFAISFQEAGAAFGTFSGFSSTTVTANLTSPIFIGAGETKTFTLNFNSGSLGTITFFNTLSLDGTVAVIPEPSSLGLLAFAVGALAFARRRRIAKA